jgi:transposase
MKCWKYGLEEDRDVIAVKNLVKNAITRSAWMPKTP